MDAATVEKLTQQYLQRVIAEWGKLDSVKLEEAFMLLQALEKSSVKNAEIATTPERLANAGIENTNKESKNESPTLVSLSQALNQADHIILLGEPGSGKSTTMKFFGLYFAGESWAMKYLDIKGGKKCIPFRILLPSYSPTDYEEVKKAAIRELALFLQIEKEEAGNLFEAWKNEKSRYQMVFLFDGLDEVENNKIRNVQKELENFTGSDIGKASRIIVCSRITGFSSLDGYRELTLKPLHGDKEVLPYLLNWLHALKEQKDEQATTEEAKTLLKTLRQQPALNRFLDNPLTLQMIAKVYSGSKTVPPNRADLYENYFLQIAEQRWLGFENNTVQRRKFETALQAIAWHMHLNGKRDGASLANSIMTLGGIKQEEEAQGLFNDIYSKLNLITIVEKEFRFAHQTIQEYFVAERLKEAWKKDTKATWRFIRPRLHLPTWKEPLSLLVAGLDEEGKIELITKVRKAKSQYESKLHRDYFLAARFIGESGSDSHKLRRPYYLQTLNPIIKKRSLAVKALGYIGGEFAVELILRGYFGKNELVRENASDAVVELDEISFSIFLESLKKHDLLWALTRDIMLRLSNIGGQISIEALIQVIKENSYHRARGVFFLSRIGDATTVPLIIQSLLDEDDDVVETSIKALSAFHADSIPYFRQALDEHKGENYPISDEEAKSKHHRPYVYNSNVRTWICDALGDIGSTECIPDLLYLLKQEKDEGVIIAAIEALGKVGDITVIQDFLSERPNFRWYQTEKALVKICSRQKVSTLLDLLRRCIAENNWMQEIIIEALGEIGDRNTSPYLINILQENYEKWGYVGFESEKLINALGKIRDNRAIDLLLDILNRNTISSSNQSIIRALGEIGDEKAVSKLIEIAENTNPKTPIYDDAIGALGKIGGSEARDALVRMLQNDTEENGISIIEALGQIADPETTDILISMLQHQDQTSYYSYYQSHAAEVLGKIGDPKAIPALITALAYRYPHASWKSAVALGQIFNKQPDPEKLKAEALPAFLDVIKSADEDFNWGALQFIGLIDDERAIPVLQKLVGKEYWHGWWAGDILSQIGGLESIPVLMKVNAQKAAISILRRWHSKSNNADEGMRKKNIKIIRTVAPKIKVQLVLNRFVALYAKLILKIKREPNSFGFYDRWRYYTPLEDTELLTTLAGIVEDTEAPRFDPMKPEPKHLSYKVLVRLGWGALAGIILGIITVLTFKLSTIKFDTLSGFFYVMIFCIAISLLTLVKDMFDSKAKGEK